MRVSAPVDAVTIRSDPGDGHAARPGQLAAAVLLPDDPDDPEEPDDPDEPLAPEELDEDSFVVDGVDEDESEDDFVEPASRRRRPWSCRTRCPSRCPRRASRSGRSRSP